MPYQRDIGAIHPNKQVTEALLVGFNYIIQVEASQELVNKRVFRIPRSEELVIVLLGAQGLLDYTLPKFFCFRVGAEGAEHLPQLYAIKLRAEPQSFKGILHPHRSPQALLLHRFLPDLGGSLLANLPAKLRVL